MKEDIFSYDLQTPIKIQSSVNGKNDIIQVNKLYFKCFSLDQKAYTLKLRNETNRLYISTIGTYQKALDLSKTNQEQLDKKDINGLINFMSEVFTTVRYEELEQYFDDFNKFLSDNICFSDEQLKNPLTLLEIKKIDINDAEMIYSKYIDFFFKQYWVKRLDWMDKV